eukprot:7191329-Pyramimonas_sp.AAC.1
MSDEGFSSRGVAGGGLLATSTSISKSNHFGFVYGWHPGGCAPYRGSHVRRRDRFHRFRQALAGWRTWLLRNIEEGAKQAHRAVRGFTPWAPTATLNEAGK